MNAAIWTLWLVTFTPGGGAMPVVTPLATYQTSDECYGSINQVWTGLRKLYGETTPGVGTLMCVYGAPPKR
jgi:hypothetical protein